MNQKESMGFIETIGLVAAIEAADVMVKSANVSVETVANADAGLITVICKGDLASCNAAVDAAKASLENNCPKISSKNQTETGLCLHVTVHDRIAALVLPIRDYKMCLNA